MGFFVMGFIAAWVIFSAVLLTADLYRDAVFTCLTLPVSLPLLLVRRAARYIKVMFYHIKSNIRTAKKR